eukprot:SAG11_NODE_527_length_8731_cov_3.883457_3_plen_92_part_00
MVVDDVRMAEEIPRAWSLRLVTREAEGNKLAYVGREVRGIERRCRRAFDVRHEEEGCLARRLGVQMAPGGQLPRDQPDLEECKFAANSSVI